MMRAFIVKELRENARWALLGAGVLSAWLAISLYSQRDGLSLVASDFQLAMLAGFLISGAALGLAQILTDTRRGRWGFIANRPLSAGRIFVAKLLAGLGLYYAATTIALLVITLLAMNTRFVRAPFSASMLVPAIYYQLAGVVGLTIGLLIGSRRAAWIGSRVFPCIAGVMVLGAALYVAIYFSEAVAITLAGAGLIALAAKAYFSHNGQYEPQRPWIKPLQVIIVGAGAAAVIALAVNVSTEVLQTLSGAAPGYRMDQYVLDRNGNAFRYRVTDRNTMEYADLPGNLLSEAESERVQRELMPLAYVPLADPSDSNVPRGYRQHYGDVFTVSDRYLRPMIAPHRPAVLNSDGTAWTYVSARRRLEGINIDGDFVGSIGLDGFHPPGEDARPITGKVLPGWDRQWLTTSDTVYRFNQARRTLETLYEVSPPERIIGAWQFEKNSPPSAPGDIGTEDARAFSGPRTDYLAVLTPGKLNVRGHDGTSFAVDVPNDPQIMASIGGGVDGRFYLKMSRYEGSVHRTDVRVLDARGQLISRIEYPPQPIVLPPWGLAQLPMSLAIPPVAYLIPRSEERAGVMQLQHIIAAVAAFVTTICLIIWVCLRYGFERSATITWSVLGALFGITALLTLWCVRLRPARVKCPSCGRRRVVTRQRCEHCDAEFPAPVQPDIEIFDQPLRAA
ncbi:MAG: hypothetical protein H7144_11525 [Burkholderiales bacterium]|nr:hypothetical protein [Phycisphaerae bacterium]